MARPVGAIKVAKQLIVQSWIPFFLALAYASWDYYSLPTAARTIAGLVKSWGIAFFLLMWFVGQWLRTSKQISDVEQMSSMQSSLDKSLSLLSNMAETAAAERPALTKAPTDAKSQSEEKAAEDAVRKVLDEVPKSPKGALLILGAELERELRQLLWASGWHQGVGKATITRSVEHLEKLGVVPPNLGSSVRAFLDIRNRLLHGYGVTDNEVLRAIDIGLTILRTVLSIPREDNTVHHPIVDIFSDAQGRQKREDVHGVALATKSPVGSTMELRVFPTTRTHFKKGVKVSWEWNPHLSVPESWYRHPDTGAITYAWSSSLEFVGRNIEDV